MKKTILTLAALTFAAGSQAQQRDYISIVGSSTVFPFATVVAENFGKSTDFKTPKIEATGSGGGFKLFCSGVGISNPDITNSSRRMKSSELDMCKDNGVTEVIEVKVGYDGIVIANSIAGQVYDISTKDIFLALAKDVPNPDGSETFVANPYSKWNEINAELPDVEIEVLGPPPTSGTRDAFVELAMEGGCKQFPWIKEIKASDKNIYKARCHSMREDGAFVEAGENDNLIVQKLNANPDALGIFGFSFLDQNEDAVQGSYVNGVQPTFEAISDNSYPISRPLYFYAKKAHVGVIPGIQEFLEEYSHESTWGEEGYLTDKGLIPMPTEEREKFRSNIVNLSVLTSIE